MPIFSVKRGGGGVGFFCHLARTVRVVWQQHLYVREGDKGIIDNAIDNYPQTL